VWLKLDLFTGDNGPMLAAGTRVTEWIDTGPSRFTAEQIAEAKEVAHRVNRETQVRPVITAQAWGLFIIERKFITDRKPEGAKP
jgi:hypothetical protein